MNKPAANPAKIKQVRRRQQVATKNRVRARLLSQMPQGGDCAEIGVWRGDFSRQILDALSPSRLYLIDPWEHVEKESHERALAARTGGDQLDDIYQQVSSAYGQEISAGQVVMMREKSGDAIPRIADDSLSFAYVDGDHSYEGVRADLHALFPKMKEGGCIALDDYHRRGWWGDGVIRAVNEFLGAQGGTVRIHALFGAQVAIQKLGPIPES